MASLMNFFFLRLIFDSKLDKKKKTKLSLMNDKNYVNLEVTEEECLQFNIILSWSPCNHMHVRISPAH